MDENLENYISLLATVLGLISLIVASISGVSNSIKQRRLLKELKKKELETILDSSDILALGEYLDNDIGKLSISDYVDNKKLTKKVDYLISRLTRFVGTEEEIKSEKEAQEKFESEHPASELIKEFPFTEKVSEEFDKIINELYMGEPWNALARLRRYIEILLKNIGEENGLEIKKVYSVTKLLDILTRNKIIDSDIANNLRYPIHVSNRAVHGQELKRGEAEEAIHHAAYAIQKLINTAPNNV
ncbi:hypothetical protein BTO15_15550 [Polaribacter sejongensis]|uniref:DUF4145 domain-containing protein n=1 Tax=Polaribacter sejongensis TaxID=985043 RepID=A0ABM6Q2F4_9FLAO|nr:hypothetical protein [Polaribacter sejongensis]AUC23428.1 hypothetical protein BTO15_15550 [Polaribacter sejongensis]